MTDYKNLIDGKMVDLIQGDSGSFCHYCNATRAEANDITSAAADEASVTLRLLLRLRLLPHLPSSLSTLTASLPHSIRPPLNFL